MKLAVVGSRSLKDIDLAPYLDEFEDADEFVSGGAIGIDRLGEAWARKNGIPVTVFLPDYDRYGRMAPLVRNVDIAEAVDVMVAFWDGKSKGTIHAVNEAKRLGKRVIVHDMASVFGQDALF